MYRRLFVTGDPFCKTVLFLPSRGLAYFSGTHIPVREVLPEKLLPIVDRLEMAEFLVVQFGIQNNFVPSTYFEVFLANSVKFSFSRGVHAVLFGIENYFKETGPGEVITKNAYKRLTKSISAAPLHRKGILQLHYVRNSLDKYIEFLKRGGMYE